jgi:hypothetical protein
MGLRCPTAVRNIGWIRPRLSAWVSIAHLLLNTRSMVLTAAWLSLVFWRVQIYRYIKANIAFMEQRVHSHQPPLLLSPTFFPPS